MPGEVAVIWKSVVPLVFWTSSTREAGLPEAIRTAYTVLPPPRKICSSVRVSDSAFACSVDDDGHAPAEPKISTASP